MSNRVRHEMLIAYWDAHRAWNHARKLNRKDQYALKRTMRSIEAQIATMVVYP